MAEDDAEDGLEQTKLAIAALIGCLVQTIAERDPEFKESFDQRVKDMYGKMRDSDHLDALAVLSWTREAIRNRGPAYPEQVIKETKERKRVSRY